MEKNKISYSQLLFTIICYIQSFSLLTAFSFSVAGRSNWLAVPIGAAIALVFLFVQLSIVKKYPGKNLFQINESVFGKYVGPCFSVLYLLYFFTLSSLNLRDASVFVTFSVLPGTSAMVIYITFMIICSWAVMKGIRVIVRYSEVVAMLVFIVFFLSVVFVWKRMNWNNLLPILSVAPKKVFQSANMIAVIPFGTLVFQMIVPYCDNQKHLSKCFLSGILIGGLFFFAVLIRDTAVLGDLVEILSFPTYSTYQIAGFTEILQGVDVSYAVIFITLSFLKISLLFYVTVTGIADLLKLNSYKPLVFVVGVLITLFARFIYPSLMEHMASAQEIIPILWLLFELLLPLITWVKIAVSSKSMERKKAESI
jgi:spore germination protein KB